MNKSSEIREIMIILKDYDPIIIGTFPIKINIAGSDIDIACHATDLNVFQTFLQTNFSSYSLFKGNLNSKRYVASFYATDIPVEIYAEPIPSKKQNGYRHMIIEDRILKLLGESFRKDIINLKKQGYKTEPAFGKLLKMKEPYFELLLLEELDDENLKEFLNTTYSTK
ncbi:MAG: DUF4269 domain-containing protein [Dysgonomonas sp.]